MEIHYIYQDQFRKESERIARQKRVKSVSRIKKVREMKDSEKDKEERKNKGEEISSTVVVSQKEQNSSETVELTEKASRIGDLNEAQQHMMGQHMGNITKLRATLGNASEEKAIKEVRQTAKIDRMHKAYGKESKRSKKELER